MNRQGKVDHIMNKRVYGVLGISSVMANWNADFSGYPKTTTSGDVFGSDKAFKYPMKKMWENEGKPVLYIKSMRIMDGKKGEKNLSPRTLKERYEQIFKVEDLKQEKDVNVILKNLFQAVDVKNFGATFAEAGANISITGAVQIGQGFNKYADTQVQEQNILSPFRDPNAKDKSKDGEEAKNATLGTKIVSDEAHYFYPFTINPAAYDSFVDLDVTEGYTEEDYKEFKEAALSAATSFATNSKVGCENEFGLFVETENDLYLPNLDKYVTFEKNSALGMNTIKITNIELFKEVADRIHSIEVYYNPYTTKLDCEIEDAKKFNIFTGKTI